MSDVMKLILCIFMICWRVQLVLSTNITQETGCALPPKCFTPPPGCTAEIYFNEYACPVVCHYDCFCENTGNTSSFLIYCPHGYVLDEHGCATCECQCGPGPYCEAPPRGCTSVYAYDDHGCAIDCGFECFCENTGNTTFCYLYCPYGYEKDDHGCTICRCECYPFTGGCEYPPVGCISRFGTNEYGCEYCWYDCYCEHTGLTTECDDIYCPYGNRVDEYGCFQCQCECHPDKYCPAPPPDCTDVVRYDVYGCVEYCWFECYCEHTGITNTCDPYCQNGYVYDEYGCNTCYCQCEYYPFCEPPYPGCKIMLVYENGCPIDCRYDCLCSDTEITTACSLDCPYGYKRDDNGCILCQCKCLYNDLCHGTVPSGCTRVFDYDQYGCPVNCSFECYCNSTGLTSSCFNYCQAGNVVDEKGCTTCQCVCLADNSCDNHPPNCTVEFQYDEYECPIDCRLRCPCEYLGYDTNCDYGCPTGYVLDEHGCNTCECQCERPPVCYPPSHFCRAFPLSEDGCPNSCGYSCFCQHTGHTKTCIVECPYGYVKDEHECINCECLCGPSPVCQTPPTGCTNVIDYDIYDCPVSCRLDCPCEVTVTCPDNCPDGYEYFIDDRGCSSCRCSCETAPDSVVQPTP